MVEEKVDTAESPKGKNNKVKVKIAKPAKSSATSSKTSVSNPSLHSIAERFKDVKDAAQMDLLLDLDDNFFARSYLFVQSVFTKNSELAAKFKYYVDILSRLHSHYASELAEGKAMQIKIRSADEKLQLALRTTATSEAMMDRLRESLEDAWRSEDASKNRQENLQLQLLSFSQNDQSFIRSTNLDQDTPKGREGHIRSMVYRERDRLAAELKDYVKRLQLNRLYAESLEGMIEANQETNVKLRQQLRSIEVEQYRTENTHNQEILNYEERITTLGKELEALFHRNQELVFKDKQLGELNIAHDALKVRCDRLSRENVTLSKVNHANEEERFKLQTSIKMLERLNNSQRRDMSELTAARKHAERELKKKSDETVFLERRFLQLSKKNTELQDQAYVNNNEIKVQEKKIAMANSKLDDALHQRDDMVRTREKLRMEITRLNDMVAGVKHEMAVLRHQMQDVQEDLHRANKQLDDKELQVMKAQREKREVAAELNETLKRIDGLEESLSIKTERLELIQSELQQKHQAYVNAKKQMEIIHSEKVMLMKTMDLCSRDRSTLQSTMAKLTHQINQLANTVALNEKEISALRNQIEQLNRAVKQKQNEIHSKERLLASTRSDLREMKIRAEQSQHTIDADDQRFKTMSCALEEVNKEKSLVGLQMVRRNDEVRLLKERLSMMQKAINRGTMQYNQRLEDIRLLKLEVANVRMSHECMQREVGNKASLRRDVIRLERLLNQERLRVTAYGEELARPCRIHRWRVLLGKDPRRFELLRKVQTLLRQNIKLSLERENMAKSLEESKRQYEGLKRTIKHMPDPSVREKLCVQQRINRKQSRRLKAATAELRINEIDLKARECLINGFQEQLRQQHQLQKLCDTGCGDGKTPAAPPHDERFLDTLFDSSSTSNHDKRSKYCKKTMHRPRSLPK
ncbi:cilia- and flagella-associated protein 58 [Drosophila bipectinata]|uniref:cilia- and flagella-associated protein 58 n=1 Tax=Drosophila bipectinata TaxID=42026 RepID=UPI001C89F934|nr:cilia- and flagella-associated protein 58 [Drosophila bipectinata]